MKIGFTVLCCLLIGANCLFAADSKKEARVTQIIREVKILPAEATARAAVLNDRVAEDTGVRTGSESRSELTFVDLTITRLGANSVFSFNKAGRNNEIDSGSILLRVPKDSGGGRIRSSAVTVAVTGTTVILETAPAGRNRLFVLEGAAHISLVKYPKQFQNLRAAQMVEVPPGATTIPTPTNFDLSDLMKKHPLIRDFPPLPSQDLIIAASQQPPPQVVATVPGGPPFFPAPPAIRQPGSGSGGGSHGAGGNQPPRTPTPRPGGSATGKGGVVGPNNLPQPTPVPVIPRTVPGRTYSTTGASAATTGTSSGSTRSTPPRRRKTTKPPNTTHQGPN